MKRYPRLGGLLLAAIGVFLAKITIYDVWQQASASAPELSLHMKGVVLSIAAILGGFAMVVAGPAVENARFRNPETNKLTFLSWTIAIVLLAPAFGFYWWFEHKLAEMGYQF